MSWLKQRAAPLLITGASAAVGGTIYQTSKPTTPSNASLNPHTFTPYTLVDKQTVSPTSAIFTLRNTNATTDSESVKQVQKRSIWSVQIKQPQLQIARAYTPLPPAPAQQPKDDTPQDMRLLIRHETAGEVSTYLHALPAHATLEVRGPNTEFQLPRDIIEVLFLAGGTGIAPAMQVAQALGRRTGSRMEILWANRRREECVGGVSDARVESALERMRVGWARSLFGGGGGSSRGSETDDGVVVQTQRGPPDDEQQTKGILVRELEALKMRSGAATRGLRVDYFVDEEGEFIRPADVESRIRRRRPHEETTAVAGSKLVIVSGPEGFIEYWAGKKVWAGGREVQGPLGGQLAKMDLGEWKVVKL
ncbi:hypothetical protein BDW02DRAFT_570343 [Decorospora gaudefroyi]|uniref:FAD-binding FR-type domain-containing protein n=1 Tax=Decorospora gaudefroyi TaxID=184978 RepID=A0A6A5K952_9PLEO|nr:hypothetical protein BDW02DRAFT_570343 [Decorospora gaudefroyi]